MKTPLQDKHILLGVTGSIACYKAADLASKLTQAGALVDVILTHSAEQFIHPLSFQSVTGRRAFCEADLWGNQAHVLHVGLGHSADLLVIAPATANTIAKLAHGIADNLLTVTALAASCPLMIAPAMDGGMFEHPATQANLEVLVQRGALIAGPAKGHLASGLEGVGRLLETQEIMGQIRHVLGKKGPLKGRKVVVTAGGTQEPLDPVRTITNRSSGKQGFSLAQAALDLGADVTLIAGITPLSTPTGAWRIDVQTAQEMLAAVLEQVKDADVLLMAAAVADFRPKNPTGQKIKKSHGIPQLELEATPDILAAVAQIKHETGYPRISVGFAAESKDLLANARRKLTEKQVNMIVANDITAEGAGFAVDTNLVTLLEPSGEAQALPQLSKEEVAQVILERVVTLLEDANET
ncbi:MAG: bifunctional phosphopantothenoylcysteine decarboxylase/phosphopantothenate--cysteine ligase CoaBC [Anaerolineales bacterium]|jgi:phosphopantothenoylcysteine decarboxylase / phosphopantothenate---cysteine ligase